MMMTLASVQGQSVCDAATTAAVAHAEGECDVNIPGLGPPLPTALRQGSIDTSSANITGSNEPRPANGGITRC